MGETEVPGVEQTRTQFHDTWFYRPKFLGHWQDFSKTKGTQHIPGGQGVQPSGLSG